MHTTTKLEKPSIKASVFKIKLGTKIIKDQKAIRKSEKNNAAFLLEKLLANLLVKIISLCPIIFLHSFNIIMLIELVVPKAEIKINKEIKIVNPFLADLGKESIKTLITVVPCSL